MARILNDIKSSLKNSFMNNEAIKAAYGLEDGDEFDRVFSSASLENILMVENPSIMILDLEQWADTVEAMLNNLLESKKAHRPLWYQQMALQFMVNKLLVDGEDYYDTSGMTESEIEDAKIVKFCAVSESSDSSELTIKIATQNGTVKEPVTDAQLIQCIEYIEQIKDAGVKINPVNLHPYQIDCEIDIYYDRMLIADHVKESVIAAIEGYVNNLPFNGEFSNMSMVDAIQLVPGVNIVQHKWTNIYNQSGDLITSVDGVYIPLPGYMELKDTVTINMKPHVS